jgi:hypothetical protein
MYCNTTHLRPSLHLHGAYDHPLRNFRKHQLALSYHEDPRELR